jgi:hypothetical protein
MTIIVSQEDGLFLIAPREDMMKGARIFDPQLSCQSYGSWARVVSMLKTVWQPEHSQAR